VKAALIAQLNLYASRLFRDKQVAWQFIKHLIVGSSGVIVNYFLFITLKKAEFTTLESVVITHIVLISYIFPLQKYFTFGDNKGDELKTPTQITRFLLNDLWYSSLDFLLSMLFIDILGLPSKIGKICALAILTPMSFLIQRYWIFRHLGM